MSNRQIITVETILDENKELKTEITKLTEEIEKLKEHLKKYTAPKRNKKYYENHKEELLDKIKKNSDNYKEKRKEYNKRSYQKRKEKIQFMCGLEAGDVVSAPNVENIYEIPINFEKDNIGARILKKLSLKSKNRHI